MIVLPAPAFRDLCSRLESFRDQVFARFSARMTEMMELVAAVAFQKLDQRLASSLISRPNPIRVTHQALADELGSIREIVSRLLKSFADQGWISSQPGADRGRQLGQPWSTCCGRFVTFVTDGAVFPALTLGR